MCAVNGQRKFGIDVAAATKRGLAERRAFSGIEVETAGLSHGCRVPSALFEPHLKPTADIFSGGHDALQHVTETAILYKKCAGDRMILGRLCGAVLNRPNEGQGERGSAERVSKASGL